MTHPTYQHRAKYAEIIAWCEHMGSYSYYTQAEIWRAIEADAPSGTIYMRDGVWTTVYEMKNTALQAYILRRASEIRTNFANKIAQELGDDDLQNTMYNREALQQV